MFNFDPNELPEVYILRRFSVNKKTGKYISRGHAYFTDYQTPINATRARREWDTFNVVRTDDKTVVIRANRKGEEILYVIVKL